MKKNKNYVVQMWAPVSARVRAKSPKEAIRRALAIMGNLTEVNVRKEADGDAAWLEAMAWKHHAEDPTDGGVFVSECQGDDAEIIGS